jgi:hypothetical protein
MKQEKNIIQSSRKKGKKGIPVAHQEHLLHYFLLLEILMFALLN